MSDVKKIATRESYGRTLVELGKENDKIVVLDADLAESTKTGVFKKAFPERHFDCGIAEADMIGIAAGLAAAGMVPFASSFAISSSEKISFSFFTFSGIFTKDAKLVVISSSRMAHFDIWVISCLYFDTVECVFPMCGSRAAWKSAVRNSLNFFPCRFENT